MSILEGVVFDAKKIWQENKGKGKVARAAMALVIAIVKDEMGEFPVCIDTKERLIEEYREYLDYVVHGLGRSPVRPFSISIEKGKLILEEIKKYDFLEGCHVHDSLMHRKNFFQYIRDNG